MKVREWMQTDPVSVTPETGVTEVARAMVTHKTPRVVVVDGAGGLQGIITATDLISKHAQPHLPTYFSLLGYSFPIETRKDEREIERALAVNAADLMSHPVISISPDADIDEAATLMVDREVSCLAVLENGSLAGVIDEFDIVRLLVVEEDGQPGTAA